MFVIVSLVLSVFQPVLSSLPPPTVSRNRVDEVYGYLGSSLQEADMETG